MNVTHTPAVEEPGLELAGRVPEVWKVGRWRGGAGGVGGTVLERATQACLQCGDPVGTHKDGFSQWVRREGLQGFPAPDLITLILRCQPPHRTVLTLSKHRDRFLSLLARQLQPSVNHPAAQPASPQEMTVCQRDAPEETNWPPLEKQCK